MDFPARRWVSVLCWSELYCASASVFVRDSRSVMRSMIAVTAAEEVIL